MHLSLFEKIYLYSTNNKHKAYSFSKVGTYKITLEKFYAL